MSELRLYFDESVELAVGEQLAAAGLDVVSAHSLDALGDTDANHLQRATEMGRMLCTYDSDFLVLAKEFTDHAGIFFAQQQKASIGSWVREIRMQHGLRSAENMQGQIVFLSMR